MVSGSLMKEQWCSYIRARFYLRFIYTILPHAVRSTEGSMKLQEASFDVLEADVSKKYSTTGLRSYRKPESWCCNLFG